VNDRKIRFIKGLDRIAGALLCNILSLFTRGSSHSPARPLSVEEQAKIGKILVIRPGGIGDAVLFYPLLLAIKSFFPRAELHILAEKRNAGVLVANDIAGRIFLYDRFLSLDLFRVLFQGYDVVIDTEQYHNLSAIVALLTGARFRCGFDTGRRRDLFTHRVPYSQKIYEVYSFLSLFSALTGRQTDFDKNAPFYPVEERFIQWARQREKQLNAGRIAAITPGASIPERRWAPDKFAELVQWLVSEGFGIVIIGGKSDMQDAALIVKKIPSDKVLDLTGQTSIPEAAAITSLAEIYISSDTGILHIAYGVGTPTVHLFGPGILEKWAPVGERYIAITKNLQCSPCTQYGYTPPCPIEAECMKLITMDEVREAVTRVLHMKKS
jgi:ADP-heptose:LPS heptosyltransferase